MATTNERRIFFDADDGRTLILALDGGGVFVPTRLDFGLGDAFTLSVHIPGVRRSLDLPVRVIGRRVPRGATGVLSTGVQVALADRNDPLVHLMLDIASGSVVDFETRLRERMRLPVDVTFADLAELRAEFVRLVNDDDATFPGPVDAFPGDRLRVTVRAHGALESIMVDVEVKGLNLHPKHRGAFVRLFDEDGYAAVTAVLTRGAQLARRRIQ